MLTSDQKSSENVNSEVLNTIRMLASVSSGSSISGGANITNASPIQQEITICPNEEPLHPSPVDELNNQQFICK